jgi:hypothetical protein
MNKTLGIRISISIRLKNWLPYNQMNVFRYKLGRVSDAIKQHWCPRFPACNNTDTDISDTPVVETGVTAAQIFIGCDSLVADVLFLKDKVFVKK